MKARRSPSDGALLAIPQAGADSHPVDHLLAGLDIDPRDYQKRVVGRVIAMMSGPHIDRRVELPAARSVLVESPTGSGKTVMGLLVARHAQQVWGMKVVWTAMRRNLLAQAERENRLRGFDLDIQFVSMFDKSPPRGDLLIVDEAQHDATRSMASLHATIGATKVLGLSATPFRTDRFGLCFERNVREAGIRQLILDGYLSPYAHHTIPTYSPEAVAATYLREPARWGQTLIFFRTLADCRECAAHLAAAGVASEIVSGSSDRETQIDRFVAGDVRVILSVSVLAEGFDCPSLQTVFCRPASRGPTVQMAGRVLRLADGLPQKTIVQCADTKHPFPGTAPPAVQYVESGEAWRSIGLNTTVEEASARMLELLVHMSRVDESAPRRQRSGTRIPRGVRRVRPWRFPTRTARRIESLIPEDEIHHNLRDEARPLDPRTYGDGDADIPF
jgi:hypothetical protein